MRKRGRWPLSVRVALLQAAIVLVVVGTMGITLGEVFATALTEQYSGFSLGIARTVAGMPQVQNAVDSPDATPVLQPLAEMVRKATGVSFVVITNRAMIRLTHPNPELIGKVTATPTTSVLGGTEYVRTESGASGISVRGRVPIVDATGQIVGVATVGVLVDALRELGLQAWLRICGVAVLSLLLGVTGSVLLARRIKREILDLEPAEIAAVFKQREAMLQAMREGVIAVDAEARITSVNEEARRLLALHEHGAGRAVAEVLPHSLLPEVVRTGEAQFDEVLTVQGRILVVNSVPMLVQGRIVGAVATFRDHTEVDGLVRELAAVRQYAEALRAQSHEFSNKLHTISGMIELGWYDQVPRYIAQTSSTHQERIEAVTRNIHDPDVAAVLIGKAGVAAERGVTLAIHPSSRLPAGNGMSEDLVTILGNLIQNAIEEVCSLTEEQRLVKVTITDRFRGTIHIRVTDRGGGIPDQIRTQIFETGFTTKAGGQRGIGLSLVKSCVERLNGTIRVRNRRGASFDVALPMPDAGPAT